MTPFRGLGGEFGFGIVRAMGDESGTFPLDVDVTFGSAVGVGAGAEGSFYSEFDVDDFCGRTLKINEAEAETIRTLYALYEQHGTLRAVKTAADELGLRSRRRRLPDGSISGGGVFDRGHIHHILTNPIYAGRIRHRREVYDGQHTGIIDPERWDAIQRQLQDAAAGPRGKASAARKSVLCGKLFDETGDRLTPSHSKTRSGTRLRYYVSNRLVVKSAQPHQGAWRLPADDLERRVADLVRSRLATPGFGASLVSGGSIAAIEPVSSAMLGIVAEQDVRYLLALVERIEITPGSIRLKMNINQLSKDLPIDPEDVDTDRLISTHPFQLRKRGVETKIILADAPAGQDETLIRNIARAHAWFERIKGGETFAQIAEADGTSKRRIQQVIDLAFLAPDIVRDILHGQQPIRFTSDWCKSHDLPSDWPQQRARLAGL